jgi:hypothetical protein
MSFSPGFSRTLREPERGETLFRGMEKGDVAGSGGAATINKLAQSQKQEYAAAGLQP